MNNEVDIKRTYDFNADRPGLHGPFQVYGWKDQAIGGNLHNGYTINFDVHYFNFDVCSAKIVGKHKVHVTIPAIPYSSCAQSDVFNDALHKLRIYYHDGLVNAEIHHLNDMNDKKSKHSQTKVIVLHFPEKITNDMFSQNASDGVIDKCFALMKDNSFEYGSACEQVGWNPCQVKWFVSVHEEKHRTVRPAQACDVLEAAFDGMSI
jgi:hypothetical protein